MQVTQWAKHPTPLWPASAERLQVVFTNTEVKGDHFALVVSQGTSLHGVYQFHCGSRGLLERELIKLADTRPLVFVDLAATRSPRLAGAGIAVRGTRWLDGPSPAVHRAAPLRVAGFTPVPDTNAGCPQPETGPIDHPGKLPPPEELAIIAEITNAVDHQQEAYNATGETPAAGK